MIVIPEAQLSIVSSERVSQHGLHARQTGASLSLPVDGVMPCVATSDVCLWAWKHLADVAIHDRLEKRG